MRGRAARMPWAAESEQSQQRGGHGAQGWGDGVDCGCSGDHGSRARPAGPPSARASGGVASASSFSGKTALAYPMRLEVWERLTSVGPAHLTQAFLLLQTFSDVTTHRTRCASCELFRTYSCSLANPRHNSRF